jgi:NAD-dependent DNA ligase
MDEDIQKYFRFTSRSRMDKSINSLSGLIEGISIDGMINSSEVQFLRSGLEENKTARKTHPFNELIPAVEIALADGVLTEEEKADILWLCRKLRSAEFYDEVTTDLQRLHALLGGIASDGVVTEGELRGLSAWLSEHEHLKTRWPYEEVGTFVAGILSQGKIDASEQKLLMQFFSQFLAIHDEKTIVNPAVAANEGNVGLCAVCPEIVFAGRRFCLTGASYRYSRSEFSKVILEAGGEVTNSVSTKLDYLIIGADGNPCWAYACYGRKVEQAVELRKQGSRLLIVHENDLHDAIADL